jgi:hypothetical protein
MTVRANIRVASAAREPVLVGACAGALMVSVTLYLRRWGWGVTDFDQLWYAARALLEGRDPYAEWQRVGLKYPLYYPLHAVLLTLPLAFAPREAAWSLLAGVTGFIAGFGLHRLGRWTLIAVLSPAWWGAALMGQVTPALAGAALVPNLGFILAAKPTVGLALWLSRPSRATAVGVALLTLVCFMVRPDWLASWLHTIGDAPHIRAPITRPGGFLLLLALLRWRTPEGRLLAAWAVIPRTELLYDVLPMLLVATSAASAALLTTCSVLALVGLAFLPPPPLELGERLTTNWSIMFGLIYLPALLVVLSPLFEARLRRPGLTLAKQPGDDSVEAREG